MPTPDTSAFEDRMRAEQLPELVIRTFRSYLEQLASGETGLIREDTLTPAAGLPDADHIAPATAEIGREALSRTLQIKLNGGLGTSMGLEQAKSLLKVRDDLTFLDIIARQSVAAGVPLLLMNSFSTREDSLAFLSARCPDLPNGDLPLDFCQHKVPKVDQATLGPVSWPDDPELEWCPPGHGDLYTALVTSGTLAKLLQAGYRYAFVSNADNLGATLDPALLGVLVERGLPFMMEVTDRTPADRKGGHLARRADGQLVLRERAQCHPDDLDAFQDITRHTCFNTNNIWLDLQALDARLEALDGVLPLPMIRNAKTVDPRDPHSPAVYQIETAMGAAIAIFPGADAIRVPRTRFAPVKTTGDLLAVRSDAYTLTDDGRLVPAERRRYPGAINVDLDPAFYSRIDDLEARFPKGPPSLWRARSLQVRGDVTFGGRIICENDVIITAADPKRPATIADRCAFDGGPWRV